MTPTFQAIEVIRSDPHHLITPEDVAEFAVQPEQIVAAFMPQLPLRALVEQQARLSDNSAI